MAINWGMAGQNNNALAYFQLGQQLGQQVIDKRVNNAAARFMQGDQNAIADVAKYDAGLGMQLQQRQAQMAQQQAAAEEAKKQAMRTRLVETAKLFEDVTPENYGQRIALAKQLGIDTSSAPQVYDPAWVQQNAQIMRFAADNPDKLPMIAQEFQAAGIDLNTPQGKQALLNAIAGKYGTDYADENGNIRRRPAFNPNSFAQPNIPDGAIAELKANPGTAAQFDEIFGPGASARVLGGRPAGNGPFVQ